MSNHERLESVNPVIAHSPDDQELLSSMLPGVSVKLKPEKKSFDFTSPPKASKLAPTPKPIEDGVAMGSILGIDLPRKSM